jgi:hypothetical protein
MKWIRLEKKPKQVCLFETSYKLIADTDDCEFRGDQDAAFYLDIEQNGKWYKSRDRWTWAETKAHFELL